MKRIALIAGGGRFPLLFAQEAKRRGVEVVAIGIREETLPELEEVAAKLHWIGIGELKKIPEILKKEGLKKLAMAGKITKTFIYRKDITRDSMVDAIVDGGMDRKDDSLLRRAAYLLRLNGIKVLSSTIFLERFLARKGSIGSCVPTKRELEDVRFGYKLAKAIGRLDVGQCVVVKNKAVLAVEAIEGTDEAIKRGAELGKGDVVVVKVSKPKQDMRFDIPVIGLGTLRTMLECGARCLAVEAKKTLIIDKDEFVKFADDNGIAVVGV